MTGITQSVEVETTISGVSDFRTTHVDVDRNTSGSPAMAKVKGFTENPTNLSLNDTVEVNINDELVFTGSLKRATQNEQRLVTIEAYDGIADMHGRLVKLHTDNLITGVDVIQDFFIEAFGEDNVSGTTADPANIPSGNYWIGPGDATIISEAPAKKWYIGSGDRGADMARVISDIADELNCVFWTDRRNVVRVEAFPPHREYEDGIVGHIIEMDSGEEEEATGEVIVDSPINVGELGPAASWVYNKFSTTSTVQHNPPDDDSSRNHRTVSITNQNVVTKRGAEKAALAEFVNSKMSATRGTIKLVGFPEIQVWDTVVLPEDDRIGLAAGRYTVSGTKNVVDTSNGYTTELTLRPEMSEILNQSNVVGGNAAENWEQWILQIRDSGYSFTY